MQQLEVTVEELESAVVIHAVGSVDSTTAPSLQAPLLHAAESAEFFHQLVRQAVGEGDSTHDGGSEKSGFTKRC